MINVLLFSESRYPVNRREVKKIVETVLGQQGINGDIEVSISVVGDRKMKALNLQYRNEDKTTDVLSFSQREGDTQPTPDGVIRLGDIIISFPQAVNNARIKECLVDEEINFLISHALLHLLGIHHE